MPDNFANDRRFLPSDLPPQNLRSYSSELVIRILQRSIYFNIFVFINDNSILDIYDWIWKNSRYRIY